MNEETKALVEAISSLKQDPSYIKDIVTGLLSSLLGAGVAYFTIRHQEYALLQKHRVQAVNNWVLSAEGAMQSLISIKQDYHSKLNSDPFQRAMVVRTLIGSTRKLDKDISELAFILPRKDEPDTHNIKWRQTSRIRSMVENYNLTVDIWDKRAEVERPIKEKLLKDYGELAYANVDQGQIFNSVSLNNFTLLIDLTEKAIKFTDDLILELYDFLQLFPETAETLIPEKYRKRYGPILTFSTGGNQKLENVMKKCVDVDYSILAPLFGENEGRNRAGYETGYE